MDSEIAKMESKGTAEKLMTKKAAPPRKAGFLGTKKRAFGP